MDARSLAAAAEVQVGTLNSWVQRGLIPGMTTGARGRLRHFDLDTAFNVALIVELVRIGLGANTASAIAQQTAEQQAARQGRGPYKKLVLIFGFSTTPDVAVTNPAVFADLQEYMRRSPVAIPFDSEDQLPKLFQEQLHMVPTVYTVVDIEQIGEKMRLANEEWERRSERTP